MKEQIKALVKTAYAKYGLKEASLEKLVNIIEQKINAMGTLEPEKLTEAIGSEITACEPLIGIIQSEVDSRVEKKPNPKPDPKPDPDPNPKDDKMPAWAEKLLASNKELEDRLNKKDKETTISALKQSALNIAKSKGADNEKVLGKVARLIDFNAEGMTAEQAADSILNEYNDLYKETTDGVIPSVPTSSKLSEAELAKSREEAIKKSKEDLLKDKTF